MPIKWIFPGSFDPVTLGHEDIIERAAGLCDQLVVAILRNPDKKYLFGVDVRLEMLNRVVSKIPNVSVTSFNGLLADFARNQCASAIVRGVRNTPDFDYEKDMALCNARINGTETIFMLTKAEYTSVSSSAVRQLLHFGGDVSLFIPHSIRDLVCSSNATS